MTQTVLLLHELPDGSRHFDWMLQMPGTAVAGPLTTFRVHERIDLLAGKFEGERIGDHRAVYLSYEGDIGQGRGQVKRMARGKAVVESITNEDLEAVVHWEGGSTQRYRGTAKGSGSWVFEVEGV